MRRLLALLAVIAPVFVPVPAQAAPPAIDAPPMGWNSRSLGCSVTEDSVRQAADTMTDLAAHGYEYMIIDGCWLAPARDGDDLVADPVRFPGGIAALAEHLHGKGLKLGVSLSAGTRACTGGGVGSYGHEAADGALVATWGVDYVKYDWCSIPTGDFPGMNVRQIAETLYPKMRGALGDSVAFAMNNEDGSTVPWLWGGDLATTWRTNVVNRPIADGYATMVSIWETNQLRAEYAGPGSWADPDLLQAGRGGMTAAEYRTQFSLWAVAAAPLILQSAAAPRSIVGNAEVIAVNQDPLGLPGRLVKSDGWYHVIGKPLADGSQAIVLFNESNRSATISHSLAAGRYRVDDLWTGATWATRGDIAAAVPAHGAVMYRVSRASTTAPPLVAFEVDPAPLGTERPSTLVPGEDDRVVTRVTNTGATTRLRDAVVSLDAPAGWSVRAVTSPTARTLDVGRSFEVTWSVTPPTGAELTGYDLAGRVTFAGGAALDGAAVVRLAQAPGPGTTYLSDLAWTAAQNHFGPVERDTSNGDQAAGDGRPITIQGVRYARGLGVHAPAEIEFYLAGRCTRVTFTGGVDDEVGDTGSVRFEVWADSERVARSAVLTGVDAGQVVSAAVDGARHVRLVATNGGDNAYYDHADFADATVTCS